MRIATYKVKDQAAAASVLVMVKLTPKFVSQEFPDEDPSKLQKLILPGKGVEKAGAPGNASNEV